MPSGIGASLTTLTNGTTANAPDVMADLNAINNGGVSNDGGAITTDGAGNETATSYSTANGVIRGMFFLGSPYHLTSSVVINVGSTNTYTATGGATGVPAGAKAVLMEVVANASNSGNYINFGPHGGINVGLPTIGNFAGATINHSFIVPVDVNGQIDVKSNGTGTTTVDSYIYGYLI